MVNWTVVFFNPLSHVSTLKRKKKRWKLQLSFLWWSEGDGVKERPRTERHLKFPFIRESVSTNLPLSTDMFLSVSVQALLTLSLLISQLTSLWLVPLLLLHLFTICFNFSSMYGVRSFKLKTQRLHLNVLFAVYFSPKLTSEVKVRNRPFYSCVLICLAFEWKWGYYWPCFGRKLPAFLLFMMLFSC